MLRVVIAETKPTVAAAVRSTVECLPEVELVGTATDAPSALVVVTDVLPDVVILDGALVHRFTRDLVMILKRACPGLKVILLSDHPERAYEEAAEALGADGLVFKARLVDDLPPAIDVLRQNGRPVAGIGA